MRVAPNYFFSPQFQHFKTLFPIYEYVCMYVCMYVFMYVCASFGGLDSRYTAVPTVIQISIILLPISRYCWILMSDPRYSIVILPLLFRYFFLSFFQNSLKFFTLFCCCWINIFLQILLGRYTNVAPFDTI
jgi:hypothetical protein